MWRWACIIKVSAVISRIRLRWFYNKSISKTTGKSKEYLHLASGFVFNIFTVLFCCCSICCSYLIIVKVLYYRPKLICYSKSSIINCIKGTKVFLYPFSVNICFCLVFDFIFFNFLLFYFTAAVSVIPLLVVTVVSAWGVTCVMVTAVYLITVFSYSSLYGLPFNTTTYHLMNCLTASAAATILWLMFYTKNSAL